ncbi:DPH3 homolog [Anoplopoma fimbria]|uniref:DPH3 homolog n=1 Tax=Anoplopoma fimbria TaxID=229290 RepID=UPI0023EC9AD4|nr:DPH3 homolog [Anoplopoma fimbria]
MSVFHDEVEIEDFEYDEDTETYSFPCPCGDRFTISREDLENGEEVATCPSCSLVVKVIYDQELFMSGEIIEASSSTETKLELVQS